MPCSDEVELAIVGSPAYFARKKPPTTPAALLEHDCLRVRSPRGTTWPWELERRGKRLSLDVKGSLLLDDDELVVLAARAGRGLAYTTVWSVADDLRAGTLVRVLPAWMPSYERLCVCYPGHRLVPATVRAFVELVRAHGERPRGGKPGRAAASARFSR